MDQLSLYECGLAERSRNEVLSQQYDVVWLPSPRRHKCRGHSQGLLLPEAIAEAVWYQQDARNRNDVFLHAADFVLCGEDSMSMLHEALAADAPVVSLAPQEARPPVRYYEKIQQLERQGYVQRHGIAELAELNVVTVLSQASKQRPDWRVALDELLRPLLDAVDSAQASNDSVSE